MAKSDKCLILHKSILPVVLLLLAGCTPVISRQLREQGRPDISFKEIFKYLYERAICYRCRADTGEKGAAFGRNRVHLSTDTHERNISLADSQRASSL